MQQIDHISHHICTRNCYDSCAIIARSREGRITDLYGDAQNPITAGRLCSKRQHILSSIYDPRRILYPMLQHGRGSSRWSRISWERAIDLIAHKILQIKTSYHSTLPLCLNKYSGNLGLLHQSVEGMFNSLGATTQTRGTPCFSAGIDAQYFDFGGNLTSNIRDLVHSRLILLWGINPAWTAVHTMPHLYEARRRGAILVVIDPVFTETARKADYYIQLRPGSDAFFTLALLQLLAGRGILRDDPAHIADGTLFLRDLAALDPTELLRISGQSLDVVTKLAELIEEHHPLHIWCGFGLQRHRHGGFTIRLIDALSMFTGNIGCRGGGVNYAHLNMLPFSDAMVQRRSDTRFIDINQFAESLAALQDPPIRFLWIACRNPLGRDVSLQKLLSAWTQLDFVVTADKFLTQSAALADVFLPVTTEFEELDAYTGYFHHWVGLNTPVIPPCGEAKSDLDIARLLTRRLNELAPGTSSFPWQKDAADFLDEMFTSTVYERLSIKHWRELEAGTRTYDMGIPWKDHRFATDDGKFHCCSLPYQRHTRSDIEVSILFFDTTRTAKH
ncbi:molybdopterin-dependent oxidoreductase [uncultured Selenomonas sp.]|uniref:molybdopterin-dependent oxidoreductase n=1 Tax=uncultured Selenomonas sp. TaxID=159275 RepID=UPI0026751A39|nr:molybdopterin-dependent oxidoreductase [uncultured Selenomonas sp.]